MKIGRFEFRMTSKQPTKKRAYYEAAESKGYMANHWAKADSRDVNGPIFDSLAKVRNRCRFEVANNSLALAAVTALADAVVGEGPRLQMTTEDSDVNTSIELAFEAWCRVCDFRGMQTFGQILRMVGAFNQADSGEGFIVTKSVRNNLSPVALRLLVVESDRIDTPFGKSYYSDVIEGIEVGEEGLPVAYYLSKKHPGDYYSSNILDEYDRIPADSVIHLFRPTRPGQSRGFPWLSTVLNQFAELRSYASSTLKAADVAARMAAVLETDSSLLPGSGDDYEAFDPVEIESGSMITLPKGLKLSQFKSENPSATYKEFYDCKLREIGRAFNMPFNVISGDSSSYNYSSGRLDFQNWWKYVGVLQSWIERSVCDRVFKKWLQEAMLVPGTIDFGGLDEEVILAAIPEWYWPGIEHVDPLKEANAQTVCLENKTTSLSTEYAKAGKDWEKELRQIKREKDLIDELALTKIVVTKGTSNDKNQDAENDSDTQDGPAGNKGRIRVAI